MKVAHPILSCEQSRALETRLLGQDDARVWTAMLAAGRGVANAIARDFLELGGLPRSTSILVLAGKGHNAGDALIATRDLLARFPDACASIVFVLGERALKPLAARAWRELAEACPGRVVTLSPDRLPKDVSFDVSIDGIFGFQFRPPFDASAARVLKWESTLAIRLRAAVDLPSGLDSPGAFHADFTYATGIVKSPLLVCRNSGRLRYVDLGFFDREPDDALRGASDFVLTRSILEPLRTLRPAASDKRTFGHVFVIGGSMNYPGAVLMATLAALHGGAGLVSAFVPETLAPAYAAQAPEAMWIGCPETPSGGLALEGFTQIAAHLSRASALAIGPGLGREPETLALIERLLKSAELPAVLDADALQPSLVKVGKGARILTPHAGEYLRIAGGRELRSFATETRSTVVLKGPVTQVAHGHKIHHSFFGGPVLARGGSGDLLAGLIGAALAHSPSDALDAALRGVALHGCAADLLARARGQVAPRTTELLDYIHRVLHDHDDP